MLADKTETLELYISILGLDKRYERTSTTLDSRSFARRSWLAHGNSFGWEEDRGRNWMEREGRDGFVVFLLFYRSFWAPLPKRVNEGSDNEGDRSF